nr:MAG TPA: hypothetical protein [Caudoviricetes sp.]
MIESYQSVRLFLLTRPRASCGITCKRDKLDDITQRDSAGLYIRASGICTSNLCRGAGGFDVFRKR